MSDDASGAATVPITPAVPTVYCIDTSSLIALKNVYPEPVFPGLWRELDTLVTAGRLVAPDEVWRELSVGNDAVVRWAGARPLMFKSPESDDFRFVTQIATDFSAYIGSAMTDHRADPWVVALAATRGCCVVSEEGGESRVFPKIPQMCKRYNISHKKVLQVAIDEGWIFS